MWVVDISLFSGVQPTHHGDDATYPECFPGRCRLESKDKREYNSPEVAHRPNKAALE
jgi:hypothetical protein